MKLREVKIGVPLTLLGCPGRGEVLGHGTSPPGSPSCTALRVLTGGASTPSFL